MWKKIFIVLLAGLLTVSAVSCASNPADTAEDTESTADTTPQSETEAAEETVIDWTHTGIDPVDYKGVNFTFISPAHNDLAWYMVVPEETNGEVLNDAMIERNNKIEEVFNVNLAVEVSDSAYTKFRSSVMGGEDAYQSVFENVRDLFSMAQEGLLYNWHTMPYIDLDAQWWDSAVVDQLTYKNKLYFCTGDISPATNVRVFSLVFNKDLCEELGLELPYEAVLEGSWTLEMFNEYISNVNLDVNGDGNMDYEDRWGFFSQEGNSYMMYYSCGSRVVDFDEDGNFKLVMNDAANIEVAVKALEITLDKTKTLMANPMVSAAQSWQAASNWFMEGNALMRSSVLEPVPRDYREMETDFGVLPYPKIDESQDTYYTLCEQISRMFAIPITTDAEMVGMILEAMAAQSVSTVSPAFYDVCLQGKSVRDEESAEILDILFANKILDYGLIGKIANFDTTMCSLEQKNSTDAASKFQSLEKSATTQMEKIMEKLDALTE